MIQRVYHTQDRRPFVVREAVAEDREAMLDLQRSAMEECDEYFVRTRAEFDAEREAGGDQLVALLTQENSLWIVAELEGELIGALDFHGGQQERTRHVGHFGMTVREDHRDQGVGTALIEALLLWAREHPTIEKVSTTLFPNNTRALALSTRFGFQTEGRRHREYLIRPGRYLDAMILAKWIK